MALLLVMAMGVGAVLAQASSEDDYLKAVETILCDCGCHPQSVKACACGRAAEMRQEIAGLVGQGLSGDEIIARYVAEHGEKIRIAPEARGFNLVAWLGPFVVLILATAGVSVALRRWKRGREQQVAAPAPVLDADDPYVQRLQRELEERR